MSGYTVLMHSQHSNDLDIIDASDKLQHGVPLQQIRRSYVYQKAEMNYNGYTMGSRKVPYVKVWFKTTEKPMYKDLTPDPYYAIIDVEHIPLNGNRAAAIKTELKRYFNQYDQLISDSELNKATYGALEVVNPIMDDRANDATHRPQHAGYYSPNLRVRHSLFTEIYEGDEDYLEHHGILGMKWGVRRYQNTDGSLTDAGRKRYGVEASKQKVENANGIREKKKVAAKEIAKSAAGTTAGTGAAIAAGAAANYAMKHAWQINFLKHVVAAGTAGKLGGVTLTAREAAYVLAMEWGPMATILPALATPVGQLALGATAIAGVGMTAYNVYKGVKMAQVSSELNSEANRILDEATKKDKK